MTLAPELEELQAKRNAYIHDLLDKCVTDDDRFTTSRMFGIGGSDMPKLMGESNGDQHTRFGEIKPLEKHLKRLLVTKITYHLLQVTLLREL